MAVMDSGLAAPFVRNDDYGEAGCKPLTRVDRLVLFARMITLVPLKALLCFTCIFSFYVTCQAARLLPKRLRCSVVPESGKIWCRLCLYALGFWTVKWVRTERKQMAHAGKAAPVIVSNHVSWVDILVHMSRSFPSFVAKNGTQKIPLIGRISQAMQCLYVDRGGDSGDSSAGTPAATGTSQRLIARVHENLNDSEGTLRPMLLFPEATTTNNKYMLPFKTGAFLAGAPVQPVILEYRHEGVSPAWDSIDPVWHIQLMLGSWSHSVTCYELPVYMPSEEEKVNPRLYADNVRQYMLKNSKVKETEATLKDKWAYLAAMKKKYSKPI